MRFQLDCLGFHDTLFSECPTLESAFVAAREHVTTELWNLDDPLCRGPVLIIPRATSPRPELLVCRVRNLILIERMLCPCTA